MKSRRQRRQEAKINGVPFEPQYNTGVRFDVKGNEVKVGGSPKSHKEMYGVGYERFDGKYVKVSDKLTKGSR